MIRFQGLIPAVFTPFDEQSSVNYDLVPVYAEKLIAAGAEGIFVCGTTGECTSMTLAERKSLLACWHEVVAKRIRIIAHVGGTCQQECIELARHAASLEVDAVAAVAPYYFKPATVDDLIAFYQPIANVLGDIPFYTYHMPSITGVRLPMVEFLEKGSRVMPNLNGIKFTSTDFMEMMECVACDEGRFNILNGFDEMLLCGLAMGAEGGVGSTYNYAFEIYRDLLDAFRRGDLAEARRQQLRSIDIVRIIIRHGGGVRGGKAIMKCMGLDCGNCRSPFAPYTSEEMLQLGQELRDIGFFE